MDEVAPAVGDAAIAVPPRALLEALRVGQHVCAAETFELRRKVEHNGRRLKDDSPSATPAGRTTEATVRERRVPMDSQPLYSACPMNISVRPWVCPV